MALRTPLYETHRKAGARLVEFAGWEMPVQYAGLLAEHEAVRSRVGLFDVSHMGEVVFRGPRALEALNRLFTNDLSRVVDGQAQYGCLCREDGGIVDDVVVYRRAADDLLVCVNAGNRAKDLAWLADRAGSGVEVRNESDAWAQLALQGPLAAQLLQRLADGGPGQAAAPSPPAASPLKDVADDLRELARLRDEGMITSSEYERKRDELASKM